jgi:inositol hexakisphosphate/diphosphoinositol-pentakisphosphate kinase
MVNGIQIDKPLVEKPVDAEDHNIYIYYPLSAGGGSKRLYRKIDDRSSTFYPTVNELRKTGSFIYEKFVVTQGTDVKVYTMGPDYAHAEARKSPVVDGRVNRDAAGLEVRYPVILSPTEKEIARKIVLAFRQNICGFDILRVKGISYCCDVNGFSFVKNSRKYYDDASQLLCEISLIAVRPEIATLTTYSKIPSSIRNSNVVTQDNLKLLPKTNSKEKLDISGSINSNNNNNDDVVSSVASVCSEQSEVGAGTNSSLMELRAVIAVIRHGDRTPKQKMKIKVNDPMYLEYFHNHSKNSKKGIIYYFSFANIL